MDEIFDLHRILDHSYYSLSRSYLGTRDEIIDKRRKQLSDLHVFAGEVISVLKEDMLWDPLVKGAENLFGLKSLLRRWAPGDRERNRAMSETFAYRAKLQLRNRIEAVPPGSTT